MTLMTRIEALPATNAAAIRESLKEEGLAVVDFGLSDALVAEVATFTRRIQGQVESAEGYARRVQDAWKGNDGVRELATHPTVLALLAQVYDAKPLPFQTLNFPIGTEQELHSDIIHFNCWPPDGLLCAVWIALEPIDRAQGALVYVPKSHLLPELYCEAFNIPVGPERYVAYPKHMAKFVHQLNLAPVVAPPLAPGQGVIWAANLIHGGGPIQDRNATRLSQVSHYFFDKSAFYWTPLQSDLFRGRIQLRHPEFFDSGGHVCRPRWRRPRGFANALRPAELPSSMLQSIVARGFRRLRTLRAP